MVHHLVQGFPRPLVRHPVGDVAPDQDQPTQQRRVRTQASRFRSPGRGRGDRGPRGGRVAEVVDKQPGRPFRQTRGHEVGRGLGQRAGALPGAGRELVTARCAVAPGGFVQPAAELVAAARAA